LCITNGKKTEGSVFGKRPIVEGLTACMHVGDAFEDEQREDVGLEVRGIEWAMEDVGRLPGMGLKLVERGLWGCGDSILSVFSELDAPGFRLIDQLLSAGLHLGSETLGISGGHVIPDAGETRCITAPLLGADVDAFAMLGHIAEKVIVPGKTLLMPHLRKAAPVQQLATNLAVVGRGYLLGGFGHWDRSRLRKLFPDPDLEASPSGKFVSHKAAARPVVL
jgi:hypothetical protein